MDFLQSILENYNLPVISALALGLMTAISPCPLATNITATAYISKHIASKRKVLWSGILYSLGRALSYTLIGIVLFLGASKFHVARLFQQNGEKLLGPLLILVGLIMLNLIRLDFLGKSNFQERWSHRFRGKGLWGSFLLGVIFALAFCPYSGALYFGMLIPMTISSASGLVLPIVFALGTGLPVILFTYLLVFAAHKVSGIYNRIKQVEKVMRFVAGSVFVLAGLYYVGIFVGIL